MIAANKDSFYDFVRVHKTLGVAPAMAVGVSNHVWLLEEILYLAEKKIRLQNDLLPSPSLSPIEGERTDDPKGLQPHMFVRLACIIYVTWAPPLRWQPLQQST